MKSFDEWLEKEESKCFENKFYRKPSIKDAYEAGQQSKQAEIDELRKRIDSFLDYVFGLYSTCDLDTEMLEKILKGNTNDH